MVRGLLEGRGRVGVRVRAGVRVRVRVRVGVRVGVRVRVRVRYAEIRGKSGKSELWGRTCDKGSRRSPGAD